MADRLYTGEEIRAMGYNPDTVSSIGGKYYKSQFGAGNGSSGDDGSSALFDQLKGQYVADTDKYINELLSSAKGDMDFAIKQLKRNHEVALGNNDAQTAKFIESVADALEEKIGAIPYDYQVGVERTTAKQKTVLDRLAEDERVWKQEKTLSDEQAKVDQQEGLLKRGILTGTRKDAQGLAGKEVKTLDETLGRELSAYDRALARSKEDINTETSYTLADLKTGARRDTRTAGDTLTFGSEAAKREYEARQKELERQRQLGYKDADTYAANKLTRMQS